jgi:hypothetical protein
MKSPREIYVGSDGSATMQLYKELEALGPAGIVALNLFRAYKNSARAKVYRGGIRGKGSYSGMAYERKNWAMGNLCKVLTEHAAVLGIRWGWKMDPDMVAKDDPHIWVLYVDLPNNLGQVSFHTAARGEGPDYPGEWDGAKKVGDERIIKWVEMLLTLQ